jgi:hypothetical protein
LWDGYIPQGNGRGCKVDISGWTDRDLALRHGYLSFPERIGECRRGFIMRWHEYDHATDDHKGEQMPRNTWIPPWAALDDRERIRKDARLNRREVLTAQG